MYMIVSVFNGKLNQVVFVDKKEKIIDIKTHVIIKCFKYGFSNDFKTSLQFKI